MVTCIKMCFLQTHFQFNFHTGSKLVINTYSCTGFHFLIHLSLEELLIGKTN